MTGEYDIKSRIEGNKRIDWGNDNNKESNIWADIVEDIEWIK